MATPALTPTKTLATTLASLLDPADVITDPERLTVLSSDVYATGTTPALAIAPTDRARLPAAIKAITDAGYAVLPRGGGLSYTGGYVAAQADTVVVDMSRLTAIIDVNPTDMTVTVEAGVTWCQLFDALTPLGLRLPFFGTFSGYQATVGGGLSNGALFLGTARYGTAAEMVQGLEVVTAQGELIRTGQAAFKNGRSFWRSFGPDLTGLFVHDAGALGIKTVATMRLIRKPTFEAYASFVFADTESVVSALSAIARSGRAEDISVFDPEATRRGLDTADLKADVKRLVNVVRGGRSLIKGLKAGAELVGAGRSFVADDSFTLHVACGAYSEAAVDADLAACKAIADEHGGGEIANSMPKMMRANPFEPPNSVLGSQGDRWAALNAKITHSDALALIKATDEILARHRDAMQAANVSCTRLFIAISTHVFSFEPVLRWFDSWLPLHQATAEPAHLAKLKEPSPNPEATALVATIRAEIVELFAEFGAGSNQIGRTYHYFTSLNPETAALLVALKQTLDPAGLMNPGVLELPTDAVDQSSAVIRSRLVSS